MPAVSSGSASRVAPASAWRESWVSSPLSKAVENAYQWRSDRGLAIVKTAIVSIEYDATTRELLKATIVTTIGRM